MSESQRMGTSAVSRLRIPELMLRGAAIICCIVALVVMVTDKQRNVIQVPGFNGFSITKTAKFSTTKAFVYLVYASGIGAAYTISVLVFSLVARERPNGGSPMAWLIFLFDQLITYVLLAAASASAEVAYMASRAPPELSWLRICTLFGRFCNQLGVALITSFIATTAFAFLSAVSAYHLFNKSLSYSTKG